MAVSPGPWPGKVSLVLYEVLILSPPPLLSKVKDDWNIDGAMVHGDSRGWRERQRDRERERERGVKMKS